MELIKKHKNLLKKLNPLQLLVIGYFLVTMLFTFLLMLPISSKTNTSQNFIDALFAASSGISTTGLAVVDIGSFYSLFGQIMLMLDFQVGGIGYMAFIVFMAYLLHTRLSINNKIVASESVAGTHPGYSYNFFAKVIIFTLIFETIGGIILFFYWLPSYSFLYALYLGFFHSISAFCTAGFCLFPDSLMSHKNSITINLVIDIISIIGGIGFYVLDDIYLFVKKTLKKESFRPLSVHSKLAITVTVIVLVIGTGIIFVSQKWAPSAGIKERLLASSFQAISASTTDGYNTIDIGAMSSTGLFMIILLMFMAHRPAAPAAESRRLRLECSLYQHGRN